jgi:exopolyphosphatase/guanosine-5'-triphosphate,3'-diphosphate pyrophosphatase
MTRSTRASAYVPTKAIIDIGSNTVRLVIYGGPARAPDVLHNEKVTARLGKSVAENGKLGQRAMGNALASLRAVSHAARSQGHQRRRRGGNGCGARCSERVGVPRQDPRARGSIHGC